MAEDSRILPERLAGEPEVARGCSVSEHIVIAATTVGVWLTLGGVIGVWLGAWQLGLAAGVIAIVTTLGVVPAVLQRIKRGRPFGYYQHRTVTALHDARIWPSPYVRASGRWDLGRQFTAGTRGGR